MKIELISVDKLRPDPKNPRKDNYDNDDLENMAKTFKHQSIIQPIEIDEHNQIIIGELRWRASKIAELKEIPCIRKEGLNQNTKLERQLIENIHHQKIEIDECIDEIKLLLENELSKIVQSKCPHVEDLRGVKHKPDDLKKCRWLIATTSLSDKLGIKLDWLRRNLVFEEEAPPELKKEAKKTKEAKKKKQKAKTKKEKDEADEEPTISKTVLLAIHNAPEEIKDKLLKLAREGANQRKIAEEIKNHKTLKSLKENLVDVEQREYTVEDFIKNIETLLYSGVQFYKRIPFATQYMSKDQKSRLKRHVEYVLDILNKASDSL